MVLISTVFLTLVGEIRVSFSPCLGKMRQRQKKTPQQGRFHCFPSLLSSHNRC